MWTKNIYKRIVTYIEKEKKKLREINIVDK